MENKGDIPIHDDRWDLVLRVLESREFSRAHKLKRFLQYICRAAIADETQNLHEQQIGCEVFGRREGYNTAEDNIVRVEARELRKRLDRYFCLGEGVAEPVRILVPKGAYVPVFEKREGQLPAPKPPEQAGTPSSRADTGRNSLVTKNRDPSQRFLLISLIMGVLILLVLGMAYSWVGGTRHASSDLSAIATAKKGVPRCVLALLFPQHSEVKEVVADSSLAAAEIFTGRTVSLSQYWSRQYLKGLPPHLHKLARWPFTSLSDVMVTSKILKALLPTRHTLTIQYPRDLTFRDVEAGNTIFLGSAYSDPWLHVFDSHTNFTVTWNKKAGKLCFGNKDPKPGESGRYCSSSGPPRITYALISFLPNLLHDGDVLVLQGTDGAGTEAAGDFVIDPYYAAHLAQYLPGKPGISPVPYFEILITAEVLDNAPGRLRVVASRLVPHP